MRELNLLRYLPGASPVHRLWAGTKMLAVVGVGIGLAVNPSWPAEAVAAGLLGLGLALARVPWGARPRLPRWFYVWLGLGAALALAGGGKPEVHLAGAAVGLGGLALWARFTCLAALALLATALLAWTTPMSELAPALARMGAPLTADPLRRLRLPVAEVAVLMALCVRCLVLLVDELRLLVAARRARRSQYRRDWGQVFDEGVDLLVATLVVATRRAGEMGEAMETRGGFPSSLPRGARPGLADAVALMALMATVAGMVLA